MEIKVAEASRVGSHKKLPSYSISQRILAEMKFSLSRPLRLLFLESNLPNMGCKEKK